MKRTLTDNKDTEGMVLSEFVDGIPALDLFFSGLTDKVLTGCVGRKGVVGKAM